MREEKIAYKHKKTKLMNKTTFFVSLLIVATLVFSSTIPAIKITNTSTKMNEKAIVVDKRKAPEGYAVHGPAPGAKMLTLPTSLETIDLGMNSQSNNGNSVPLSRGETMFAYLPYTGPVYFDIEDPGTVNILSNQQVPTFASGGTWTCDERWLVCTYQNGELWQIDPETGDITEVGGGGTQLHGLAQNPTNNLLYGIGTTALYLINPEDGTQELIAELSGNNGQTLIAIMFDADGICYGWDVKFSGETYLYTINIDTGECTTVGGMGKTLCYAQDGDFLRADDVLYMTAYIISPEYGGYLCTCDKTTAELTIIGQFQSSYELDASMFRQQCMSPEHDVGVKSIDEPQDGYALPIINPEVSVKNYGNNSEYTDVQFEIIKCEAGPTLLLEDFTTWPPAGWEYYGYSQSWTNKAGGMVPEALYAYESYTNNGYMVTAPVNATGFEKINVLFHLFGDFYYSPYFYLQYRKNASSPWRDVSPWKNPVSGDLGPEYYQIGCYGWGEDIGGAFQVRWYFGSYYYYLQSGSGIYIDDVQIQGCAGCAEYADLAEDILIPYDQTVSVQFGDWTPSEWQNESSQNTYEDYPLTAYTLLEDNNGRNDKKQRLLHLYYPWLHDVAPMGFEGPTTGPAQTFPMGLTIKNIGQYDECCFKVYAQVAEMGGGGSGGLLEEYFDDYFYPAPPGWTNTHPDNWVAWYSNYAGGSPYELAFQWYPAYVDTFRFYTPPIDTTGLGSVEINYLDYLSHFGGPYTLKLETSVDAVSWTTVWELVDPTSGWVSTQETISTQANVGSDTFYVSWTFEGDSYNINYWWIDNIVIKGFAIVEPEYTDSYCIETLEVGEEKFIQFDDWTPAFLAEEKTGTKRYALKFWTDMMQPEDNNHANDAIAGMIDLDFFHDVGIEVAAPMDRGIKMLWDNGDTNGDDGYLLYWSGSTQYRDLDDFELKSTSKISEIQLLIVNFGGIPTNFEVRFRKDENKKPSSTIYATSKDVKTTSKTTGRYWFGYAEVRLTYDFEPIQLAKGFWWVEGALADGQPYTYWMIHPNPPWRTECWFNWPGYFGAGSGQGYPKRDFSFTLWGQAGAEVFVNSGEQDIDGLALNVGTFPETGMTCYAEINEFYTDCENGTLVYEDNITDIDILKPLTGTKLLNFKNYDFQVEGLYRLDFNLLDDDDDYPDNNLLEYLIGCDLTPPVTTHALSPAAPDGLNNWYVSDVEVNLTAADPSIGCDSDGSGVQEIKYQVDDEPVQSLPGDQGSFTVTKDSTMHTIKYWSIDNVGNTESQKTIQFKQDQTPPSIEFAYEYSGTEPPYTFTFNATATDVTSTMQRVEFYLNSELQETIIEPGPYYVWIIQYVPVPVAIFRAIAYDFAGLSAYDDVIDPVKSKNIDSKSISTSSQNNMRLPLSK